MRSVALEPAAGGRSKRVAASVIALAILVTLALAGVALLRPAAPGHRSPPAPRRVATAMPVPAPPPVMPTVFADIAPDDARASNAAVPFEGGKIVPARPFLYGGTPADRAAALTCLTAAVLYEAGDDAPGEQAVAQVVLNRLRHPAFPKTVCGVVFQGSERPTGCQFTFTCDGALQRVPSAAAWTRAREIAEAALAGHVAQAVGTATHYHTDWVVPYWRDSLTKIAQVHTQIFYRWPGWWGTPAAFVGRPQPLERLDPRLLALAGPLPPGVATTGTDVATMLAGAAADTPDGKPPSASVDVPGVSRAALKGSVVRLADLSAGQFVVQLDPAAFPGSYAVVALALCRDHPDCLVWGWRSPEGMPRALPFVPHGVRGMSFLFRKASVLGTEQPYWNCAQMPRADKAQCLPGTE